MKLLMIGDSGGKQFSFLKDTNDVRTYVDMFSSSFLTDVPVIGDLSLLSKEALSVLLKFIEDGVTDIICYASRDNINPVLMSRFDVIEKKETFKVGQNDFINFLDELNARERVESVPKLFLSVAGDNLGKFMLFRNLKKGVISRIAEII